MPWHLSRAGGPLSAKGPERRECASQLWTPQDAELSDKAGQGQQKVGNRMAKRAKEWL